MADYPPPLDPESAYRTAVEFGNDPAALVLPGIMAQVQPAGFAGIILALQDAVVSECTCSPCDSMRAAFATMTTTLNGFFGVD